jgi:hypothetical protein
VSRVAIAVLGLALATTATSATTASAQWTRSLDLAHGAFDQPPGAPDAIVHAPRAIDPRTPLDLVIFLHGYRGCAQVLAGAGEQRCRPGEPAQRGWDLIARHDEAGTPTLFAIAQLALFRRDGSPGRFARPGGFRAFVDELLAALATELGGRRVMGDLASITLVAHSAAFETTLAILRHDGAAIRNVVLLDALYSGGPAFLAWVAADPARRLVTMHAGAGTTGRRHRELARRARRTLADALTVTDQLELARGARMAIVRVRAPHAEFPARYLAPVLRLLLTRTTTASGR